MSGDVEFCVHACFSMDSPSTVGIPSLLYTFFFFSSFTHMPYIVCSHCNTCYFPLVQNKPHLVLQ
jgi:hypothetical protein